MAERSESRYEEALTSYLKARVSRAQLLKASLAGAALAAIPAGARAAGTVPVKIEFPYYPPIKSGSYSPEGILDIFNITDTAEHLAVTFLTAGVNNASTIGLSGVTLKIVQAALAEEVYHVQFLESAGASTLTDSFSVPDPKMLTDFTTFFQTIEVADTLFNAAYMTATREFAEIGQPTLAKYAYQIGSVEAEHRTLARTALALANNATDVPPNNKAFETDLFLYVRDAAAVLGDLGFLGTGSIKASYPGTAAGLAAAADMASAVIQQTPNDAATSVTATDNLTGQRS